MSTITQLSLLKPCCNPPPPGSLSFLSSSRWCKLWGSFLTHLKHLQAPFQQHFMPRTKVLTTCHKNHIWIFNCPVSSFSYITFCLLVLQTLVLWRVFNSHSVGLKTADSPQCYSVFKIFIRPEDAHSPPCLLGPAPWPQTSTLVWISSHPSSASHHLHSTESSALYSHHAAVLHLLSSTAHLPLDITSHWSSGLLHFWPVTGQRSHLCWGCKPVTLLGPVKKS